MKTFTWSLFTGLVTGLALAPSAFAITGCTNSYLGGNYAIQFDGMAAPGAAAGIGGVPVPTTMATAFQQAAASGGGSAPAAGVARLMMDGNGNITSGYSAENMAGQWIQANVAGTYSVNTDCTFSIALTDADGNIQNFRGVLVNQGASGRIMQTDAATGISGSLRSIRGGCQPSDLVGTFGLNYSGSSTATGQAYSSVGVISLDGLGDLTASETRFSGGTASQAQSSGSIVVNADCSFTMSLATVSGAPGAMNFFGFASNNNKSLLIVQSDSATAVTGTAVSQ